MAKRVPKNTQKYLYVMTGTPSTMGTAYSETKSYATEVAAVNAAAKFLHKADEHLRKFDPVKLAIIDQTIDKMRARALPVGSWLGTSVNDPMEWTVDLEVTKLCVRMWRLGA
jgi:hypothetical protein